MELSSNRNKSRHVRTLRQIVNSIVIVSIFDVVDAFGGSEKIGDVSKVAGADEIAEVVIALLLIGGVGPHEAALRRVDLGVHADVDGAPRLRIPASVQLQQSRLQRFSYSIYVMEYSVILCSSVIYLTYTYVVHTTHTACECDSQLTHV